MTFTGKVKIIDEAKTFNLSEKSISITNGEKILSGFYSKKDVKEFIRLLKEEFIENALFASEEHQNSILAEIDKLAGEELI